MTDKPASRPSDFAIAQALYAIISDHASIRGHQCGCLYCHLVECASELDASREQTPQSATPQPPSVSEEDVEAACEAVGMAVNYQYPRKVIRAALESFAKRIGGGNANE